jgi:hypothetical protein
VPEGDGRIFTGFRGPRSSLGHGDSRSRRDWGPLVRWRWSRLPMRDGARGPEAFRRPQTPTYLRFGDLPSIAFADFGDRGTASRCLSRGRITPVVELGRRKPSCPLMCASTFNHRRRPDQVGRLLDGGCRSLGVQVSRGCRSRGTAGSELGRGDYRNTNPGKVSLCGRGCVGPWGRRSLRSCGSRGGSRSVGRCRGRRRRRSGARCRRSRRAR